MHGNTSVSQTTLLRIKDVKRATGLGISTIYARVANGQFPPPIKLTSKSSAWVSSEIEEWVQARIAESRAALEGES